MTKIIDCIPDLKGIDAEIFHKNLNRELTPEEIRKVRKWCLGSDLELDKEKMKELQE